MKRLMKAVPGFRIVGSMTVALSLLLSACMMNDSEDYPDFSEQLQKDLAAIDAYLAANNIDAEQDVDGLIRYVVHVDSTDTPKPTIDNCATVDYAGFLMSNGQKFDDGEDFPFPIAGVIYGWRIGIPLLNRGDSATIYIPSGLAYGYNGFAPDIPSNANLMFHVRLKKIGATYTSGNGGNCQ